MTPFEKIRQVNIAGIHASLDYMPKNAYQDYCRWVLAHPYLAEEWIQLVGMTGLTRLTFGLLEGLLTSGEFDALIPYTAPINVFSMYEVLSDNLAIGLAYRSEWDTTYDLRRQIIYELNHAIIARLRGAGREGAWAGLAQQPAVDAVSLFDQSLDADKHRLIAAAFTEQHPEIDPQAIEYSLYPNLAANVEACYQVVETLQGYVTQGWIQKGFVRRYAGLNRLMDDTPISPSYLLQLGANTIMVRPLLGYYIAVIAEEIRFIHNYDEVVENGLLMTALEDAAMIARLLNDLGPCLLEHAETEHSHFVNSLYEVQAKKGFSSFHELILYVAERSDAGLTRLKKDAKFGEFNLCLYAADRTPSVTEAIEVFREQLHTLSQLYRERWNSLRESLDIIDFETRSTLISEIILRFIGFHEQMYRIPSDTPGGEYAV
jgi:hypothetical protein